MAYTIFLQSELDWVPRGDNDPRSIARLSDSMTHSRAKDELVLFIYGAPPERGGAEFFPDVP